MSDRLKKYEAWLDHNIQEIHFELEDIHPATWAKSAHVQNLLRELDLAVTSLSMVSVFLASEKVLQDAMGQGVSGS